MNNSAVKGYVAILFLLQTLYCDKVFAQIDTEFWFAAPSVTEGHGDRPVLLRMASLEQTANVTILQPANGSWQPISIQIPANQSRSIDLTFRIGLIENIPAFNVLPRGLLIQSDQPITVYYEVNSGSNPDIFSLKGRNALGRNFMIPAQNYWSNFGFLDPPATSSFEIVATQDDTQIEVTPSVRIQGHSAGSPFTVSLNRGQTYSVVALGFNIENQLTGTNVTSDKPIAITLKDDSNEYSPCYDLGGDQIVPIEVLGTEYIVTKGFLQGGDRIFVMATENRTEIEFGDNGSNVITLNKGEMHSYLMREESTYLQSNAPIYVLHGTGFGCEVGLAIVPRINCTGTQSVSFTRSTTEFFGIFLITKTENEEAFLLNGNQLQANFQIVPGTDDQYVAARIDLTIQSATNYELVNDQGTFQLGVINGGERSGTRYAYFSDFKTLKIQTEANLICLGADAVLVAEGTEHVLWFGDPAVEGKMSHSVQVAPIEHTSYGVIGFDGNGQCLDTAYLDVGVFEWPKPSLTSNLPCLQSGSTLSYTGEEELESLHWIINGDTISTEQGDSVVVTWDEPGEKAVHLKAVNPAGCVVDTTFVFQVGGVDLRHDSTTSIDRGNSYSPDPQVKNGNLNGAIYRWEPADGLSCDDCLNPAMSPETETIYTLFVEDSLGCISEFFTQVFVDAPIYIPTGFSPNDDGVNDGLEVYASDVDLEEMVVINRWGQVYYEWERNSNSDQLKPHWNGMVANTGQRAEVGVYICVVKGIHRGSQNFFQKSEDVTLIR